MNQQTSRGAALVIVLFIVALAAILAVEMSANLMVQVQRSTDKYFTVRKKYSRFN